ncbi:MAG: hypothetical protein ACYC25_05885 [Paludibacter sp.]
MWEPKTENELLQDEKKKEKDAKFIGIFFFLLLPFILTVLNKFIGTQAYRGAPFGQTLSWTQILEVLPKMFFLSSIGGILMYLAFRKFNNITTQVCPKCGKLRQFKKNDNCDCECGGEFRLLSEMKWIENKKQEQNKD